MNHLTTIQIQQYVDGSADYMTQATCTNHLAACDRCRKEVELQKAILKTARQSGLVMPSRSFTRRVMSHIAPSRLRLATRWTLDNMGAMFAMMAVLGVTGSVVLGSKGNEESALTLPSFDLSAGSKAATDLWNGFSGAIGSTLSLVKIPPISGEGNLVLVFTSIAALALLDRMLKGRIGIPTKR